MFLPRPCPLLRPSGDSFLHFLRFLFDFKIKARKVSLQTRILRFPERHNTLLCSARVSRFDLGPQYVSTFLFFSFSWFLFSCPPNKYVLALRSFHSPLFFMNLSLPLLFFSIPAMEVPPFFLLALGVLFFRLPVFFTDTRPLFSLAHRTFAFHPLFLVIPELRRIT